MGTPFFTSSLTSAFLDLKPVFHSRISPPLAKNFDKEIIFLHSFAAEQICSPATVFQLLFDLSLMARKNNK
jgi:hypothetical protein